MNNFVENIIARVKKLRLYRSFRIRIFILMLVIGIVPTVVVQNGILQNYENRAVNVRTTEVSNQLTVIANHLLFYNYLQDTSSEIINAELEQISSLYDGRVLIINANFNVVKDTYGLSEGKTIISEEVIKCFKGSTVANYDRVNGFIEITTPIVETLKAPDDEHEMTVVKGVMLTSVSTDAITTTMDILQRKSLIIQLVICIAIFALAMMGSRFLTDPFNKVTTAINEVKEGYTNEALQVPDYAETEHIVDAFNQVLRRMRILDASREEFVSNVSHEFKTPLNAIEGYSTLLQDCDNLTPQQQEYVEKIIFNTQRLSSLTGSILLLSKLENQQIPTGKSEYYLDEQIRQTIVALEPVWSEKNLEFDVDMAEVRYYGNEPLMRHVWSNLLSNAVKFSPRDGMIGIGIEEKADQIIVWVQDNGPGIPEAAMKHIFNRFYQADSSHKQEGNGLGLSLVDKILRLEGGSITAENCPSGGCKFTVYLRR